MASITETPLRPTRFELAAGVMFGDVGTATLPETEGVPRPLAELERAVLPALMRPPCVVPFSGGRDSSAVLAVATRAARREGLRLPIPVTLRFPHVPEAEESSWQERVVRHLGLADWERREVPGGELDWIGPVAAGVLRRHGLLYSPLTYSAVTGYGGDEVLGPWPWGREAFVVAGREWRLAARPLKLAYRLAPGPVRRAVRDRTFVPERADRFPWLRPEQEREAAAAWRRSMSDRPARWDEHMRWQYRQRSLQAACWSMGRLADDADCLLVSPLLDPHVLAALAVTGGRRGLGNRTAVMRALFGELLPDDVLSRPSKASFRTVFWGDQARSFATRWDGGGIPGDLVDAELLREYWLEPQPSFRSALLLQSAWLASDRASRAD
jgi:hypothetical protein